MLRSVKGTKSKRPKRARNKARAMSFRAYARGLSPASIAGAFVAVCRRDARFPDPTTWAQLRAYLNEVGAEPDAFIAARAAWRGYLLARSPRIGRARGRAVLPR